MKTTGSKRIGVAKILMLALIIVLSVVTFTACNNTPAVKSIAIDESTVSGYYVVGQFDITTVKLLVTYEDDSVNSISVAKSMLTTEAKNSLKTEGEKTVTVNYKNKTAELKVYLVAADATVVNVTFKDSAGNVLGERFALVGGAINDTPVAPEIEGRTFVGWVDAEGKAVDFSSVGASITVNASYTVNKTSYTVKFVDYNGKELSSSQISSNTSITASNAPSVNLVSGYPELEKFSWSVSFPYSVNADTVVYMIPSFKNFQVQFAYQFENDPTSYVTLAALGGRPKYDEDVTSKYNAAKAAITANGLEIVTEPTNAKKIKSDTTFVFIVKNASVGIKVYKDKDKSLIEANSTVRIGSKYKLPAITAATAVANMTLSGWKIEGSNKILEPGESWTVSSEYGMNINIIPVYAKNSVRVNFQFTFNEITLSTDAGEKYQITLNVNDEFGLYDAVTYGFIDDLLANIVENSEDYLKLLKGTAMTNAAVNTTATDNGSVERTEAFANIATYGICKISVIVNGAASFITVESPLSLTSPDLTFVVELTGATQGLVYTKVTTIVDEATVTTLKVSGLDANYANGTNIYIPDEYLLEGETKAYKVTAIDTTDLQGKTIVHFSANLVSVCEDAFVGSTLYGNYDFANVETLGANAFKDAAVDGNLTFDGLKTIGASAFENAKFNNNIVDLGNNIETLAVGAFKNTKGISEVKLPMTVKTIGDAAFFGADVDVIGTLEAVESVGENAFRGTQLLSVNLPKIKDIGAGAFSDMENLIAVNLGSEGSADDNVTLEFGAFEGSDNLAEITLGVGIKEISDAGDVLCTVDKLSKITVDASSTYFYTHENVLYAIGDTEYTLIYYANNKIGDYKLTLPDGKTAVSVNANAFDNAVVAVLDLSGYIVTNFNYVTSGTVYAVIANEANKTAAETAFASAEVFTSATETNYNYDNATQLIYKTVTTGDDDNKVTTATVVGGYKYATVITVPEKFGQIKVTAVANNAFNGFTELKTLTINATLDGWDASIIEGCSALSDFTVAAFKEDATVSQADFEGNAWYDAHNIIYVGKKLLGYNNNVVDKNGNPVTVVTAEDTAKYFVGKIPERFFFVNDGAGNNVCNITEISFADSITEIESSAFAGCEKLTTVNFNKVGLLRKFAFENCIALTNVEFTGTYLGEGVFQGCSALKTVTLNGKINAQNSKYYLPVKTFTGCGLLEEVKFEYINAFNKDAYGYSYAFMGCEKLKTYDFASIAMEEIPGATFENCIALRYVDFTTIEALTKVSKQAFSGCSGLIYVKFGAKIEKIEEAAFAGCTNLVVEIPYEAPSGLYAKKDSVASGAFESTALFFIGATVSTTDTFIEECGLNYTSTYPTVDFDFTTTMEDADTHTLGMIAFTNKIFFTEEDFTAPAINGYKFVGWYWAADESLPILEFPLVVTASQSAYAKYYSEKKGSLVDTTDIKYVYYLANAPELELLETETATWYVKQNNVASEITSWPLIMEASVDDVMEIYADISVSNSVVDKVSFGDIGENGYAIVGYEKTTATDMILPDAYDDGIHGLDEIIVVYAGAFNKVVMKEFTLPAYTKAIVTGNGTTALALAEFTADTTFNASLETITIPATVEYIADGVFKNKTALKDIVFEENSNLRYASVNAFYGSGWWLNALNTASATNGFIIAGRLALQYVGTGGALLFESDNVFETEVNHNYGFVTSEEDIDMIIGVYYADGTSDLLSTSVTAHETVVGSGVYIVNINVDEGVTVKFLLNSTDSANYTYSANKYMFVVDQTEKVNSIIAVTFKSVRDTIVAIPAEVIKLNDSIFEGNNEIETLIVNKALTEIGAKAFKNSTLSDIKYGATNTEQYSSAIKTVGEEAFTKTTPWYIGSENIILGTLYLKYNNLSGNNSITITDKITTIETNAFKNVALTTIDIQSITTLTTIKAFAFFNSNIQSIILPNGVTTLGRGAFMNCTALLSANMDKALFTELPQDAFNGDNKLQTIELGAVVTALGKDSINNCTALATIKATGITELKVANATYECGLAQTKWYMTAQAKEDQYLCLGSVLVKFILGSDSKPDAETGKLAIAIPDGIVTIAPDAFKNTSDVTEITIPNSVVTIGDNAFEACSELVTVNIGSKLETIGEFAFMNCTALKNATLPEGLKEIGEGAFKNTALTTIVLNQNGVMVEDKGYTIPDSVTRIGDSAFENVTTLTTVNLGENLEYIGRNAFATGSGNLYKVNWKFDIEAPDAESFAPIIVLGDNIVSFGSGIFTSANDIRFYVSEDVSLYISSDSFIYKAKWTTGTAGDAGFGWNFQKDGDYPMINFDNQDYTLPQINTDYLLEGTIPTPVHNTSIDGSTYTFMKWYTDVEKTTPVVYPYNVYGDKTFYAKWYVNGLTNGVNGFAVGDDGAKIGYNENTNLNTGLSTASVTSISNEGSTLYIPDTIKTVNNGVTSTIITIALSSDNTTVTDLILTNASNFNGMEENLFSRFTKLKTLTMHTSDDVAADFKVVPVTLKANYNDTEYTYTFYAVYSNDTAANTNYGSKLIAFIGNIEDASKELLGEDSTTVLDFVYEIPAGVTTICPKALVNSGLKTVQIPATLTTIGDEAFGDKLTVLRVMKNIYLTDVSYAAIPATAPIMMAETNSTTYSAYIEVKGLKSINYANGGASIGEFYAIANVLVGYSTKITTYSNLAIPSSINGFDITVLASYININHDKEAGEIKATALGLPTYVVKINANAFKKINVTNTINYDGNDLTDVANDVFGETDYYENANTDMLRLGKVLIKWQNATGEVVVPDGIVAISYNAFNGSQATKITLPSSLVSIGDNAFYGSSKLTTVNIPNSVTAIGNSAFEYCTSLTNVKIDTVNSTLSSIGNRAFFANSALRTIALPYKLSTIGDNAFMNDTRLATITFDGYDTITAEDGEETQVLNKSKLSNLTTLGTSAFMNCEALTTISIPGGVKEIKESTFNNCKALTSVEFDVVNSKLNTIGEQAFAGCIKLGSILDFTDIDNVDLVTVNLPNSLVNVGAQAFMNCSGMWGIQFNYNIATIGADAFKGCKNLAKVNIYRATAPTITNTTFVTEGYYRLRIYVNKSGETAVEGETMSQTVYNYKKAWNAVWADAVNYIYERGDMPTVTFTNGESTPITQNAEIIVSPKANFGSGFVYTFKYVSLAQSIAKGGDTNTSRVDMKLKAYGNQTYIDSNGTEYTILVADYDAITVTYTID